MGRCDIKDLGLFYSDMLDGIVNRNGPFIVQWVTYNSTSTYNYEYI